METFHRYFIWILAAVMILLFPLQYIAQSQNDIIEDIVNAHVSEFTETARHQAHMDLALYEELVYKLDQTGELYDINIEITHPVSGKEITEAEKDSTGKPLVYSKAQAQLNSPDGKLISLAAHVHTDDCYDGTLHTHNSSCYTSTPVYHSHTGNSAFGGGCYGTPVYHSHTGSCYGSGPCGSTVSATGGTNTGNYYCSVHKKNDPTYRAVMVCGNGHHHGTVYYKPCYESPPSSYTCTTQVQKLICTISTAIPVSYGLSCGKTASTVEYYNNYLSCGKTAGSYYNGSTRISATCNAVVTGISGTNPNQKISVGGTIVTTAAATYLNGNTGIVNCTASGFNANTPGTQTVTLTYSGKVGNAKTTGTRTAAITVIVGATLTGISVTPSATDVYNGTEPSYIVKANYNDGTSKTLTAGQYSKTGWSTGPGTKTVQFSYTESGITATKSVTVTVRPNLISISASPPSQTVQRYANPYHTVIAYYEDGSSRNLISGYSVTGLNTKNPGTQSVVFSYSENGISKSSSVSVIVKQLSASCPVCGTTYDLDENDIDRGCPVCGAKAVRLQVSPEEVSVVQGEALPITAEAVYQNGTTGTVTGWTSDYNPNDIGYSQVKILYQGLTAYITVETKAGKATCPVCGTSYSLNDDGTDPGCPVCSKQITGIHIVEDSVTIEKGDPLPITVHAIYKDGRSEIITDWTSDFKADTAGTFNVTVYYKSATDVVQVKVIGEGYTICTICGLEYDKSENPNGCPVCSKMIIEIKAELRYDGNQVMYKSRPDLQIVLIYKDNHRVITYNGYTITGYVPDKLGLQTVTVYYGILSTQLTIEVIDGPPRVICPSGHEYFLNDDGSDPGCPYCTDADRDAAVFYFNTTYTSEIIRIFYRDGKIQLTSGDYLTVTIIRRDVSIRSKLKRLFFGTNRGVSRKKHTFGGEIL